MAPRITCQTVVISAVNFTEGGPLTVLRESLAAAVRTLPDDWDIVAVVHCKTLIDLPRIRVVEIPDAKRAWWRRLRWEWLGALQLSRELQPDLWLSLHDITPRVLAKRQAVYCHNPAPFYKLKPREMLLEPTLLLFNLFYARLYRTLIQRNHHVIVQQEWLRQEFLRRFGQLPMVVAHPSLDTLPQHGRIRTNSPCIFLYPALARVFKNLEILGEAAVLLHKRGVTGFEIRMTVDGSENRYARWLKDRYGKTPGISFLGRQDSIQMQSHYREANALVFPSRLETWGLPITEAKQHGLPMLVADAPYARETVSTYDLVSFFNPDAAGQLADQMEAIIQGAWRPDGNTRQAPAQPFAAHWDGLWRLLIDTPRSATDSAITAVESAAK
ncbi:glycosyltransferase [Roseateles koreensis]|uniref:Glycosyltransferase n=1 Tax=Roseateles koreensis TaxID=2987526 RepID=A0ABT5KMG6_9BURK|nr:glycosyltransferase [Roseateles koreensis]MDC8784108.1 glycosyltransferase [Roseateles koreensis]